MAHSKQPALHPSAADVSSISLFKPFIFPYDFYLNKLLVWNAFPQLLKATTVISSPHWFLLGAAALLETWIVLL